MEEKRFRRKFTKEFKIEAVELKCVEATKGINVAKVLTYLKAENLRVELF